MNGRVPLTRDPAFEDMSSDDCATIQKPPRRLLKDLSAALVEEDKTVPVDLSGLAMSAKAGGEPGGLLNEAPTRRYCPACSDWSEQPYKESEPPGAALRVASGVRKVNLPLPRPLPSRPVLPPPSTRASRGVGSHDAVASTRVQQEATRNVRLRRQRVDAQAMRILRGVTLFAWGFFTATLLRLCLDHPEWRAGMVDSLSSLWPAHFAKPSK
jgi:hypothetical protein